MCEWDEAMVDLFRPDLRGAMRDAAIREMRAENGSVGSSEKNAREAETWMRKEVARRKGLIRATWKSRARNRLSGDEYPSAAVAIACWVSAPLWLLGVISAAMFGWTWSRRLERLSGRAGVPSVEVARRVLCD